VCVRTCVCVSVSVSVSVSVRACARVWLSVMSVWLGELGFANLCGCGCLCARTRACVRACVQPLHLASYHGHAGVCDVLVAAGCDQHALNQHGLAAHDYGAGLKP
jgi:hypothetical protein